MRGRTMRCNLACPKTVCTVRLDRCFMSNWQCSDHHNKYWNVYCYDMGLEEDLSSWPLLAGDCPSKKLELGVNEQAMRGARRSYFGAHG